MTILKTYARLWADELDTSLALLRELTGAETDLRFAFGSVELAAIGDFLVIAGPPAERARYSHASATVIVDDLDALTRTLADMRRRDHHPGKHQRHRPVPVRAPSWRRGDRVRGMGPGVGGARRARLGRRPVAPLCRFRRGGIT